MSDLHEHRMIPDHAIPPYAWHYKCAVEGCDYETDSSKVPSDNKDTELARLRAELEWLRSGAQEVERERNEALAQVAVLLDALDYCEGGRGAFSCHEPHDCRCPKSRATRPEDWKGKWVCECGREALDNAIKNSPAAARALLDRLQRAEAVLEAARLFEQKLAKVEGAINTAFMLQQIHGLPYHGENYGEEIVRLRKALAALEEGKA